MIRITASRSNTSITIFTVPVIPYRINAAWLWREFIVFDTLFAHREKAMKRSTLLTLVVIAAVLALFFYMSTARATEQCTVCMEFNGRSNCATAAGRTAEEATETAHTTACGPIANGMNETIACGNRAPLSVQCRTP